MSDDSMALGYALGQDSNGGNNNGGGFFGNEGLWAVIILAIIFGGMWGGNGYGNGGNGGGGGTQFLPYAIGGSAAATQADIQRGFDTSNTFSKLEGINSGLCDGFYAMNTSMMNGFHGVDNAICSLGNAMQGGFNATQMAMMQNQNALSTQIAQCCCDNRAALADLKYDMATSDCSIKTLVNQLAQQIMWGQQNGIRDLSDLINNRFCQLEMSQKDQTIADLRTQLAQCGDQNTANTIVARIAALLNCNGNANCNQGCGSCC